MERLFETLTAAVEASTPAALAAAFVWGVLSILLSPCHLASIPLIVGFIQGQDRPTRKRAFALSSLFAVGILLTIAAIGAITAAAGRLMGDVGSFGNVLVAGIFLLVGLAFLGVIPMEFGAPAGLNPKRRGAFAAFMLGLVFGIALGPCTFAFMAPMLGVTFKVSSSAPVYGAALLAAYGVGHCLVIALAGAGSAWVSHTLNWNAESAAGGRLRIACGVLVILGGYYLLHTAP